MNISDFGKGALAIFSAIITLAIISVILSKKSDTPGFIQATATALSKVIAAAVTPVPPPASSGSVVGAPAIPGGLPDFLSGLDLPHF